MNRRFVILGLAALLISLLSIDVPASAKEGRIEVIEVISKSLQGNLLGDSPRRNVSVYLPPAYDNNLERRYPVVYLLHGYGGKNTLWTGDGYVENLDIAKIANDLIASGDIEPLLIVAPDCHNTYGGSWYTNSVVTGNWEDFVVEDLLTYMDASFRTIPDRRSRGIAGHSMGGHGALKIGMKHPKLFSALYAMSPAWIDFEMCLNPPWEERLHQAVVAEEKSSFQELHWRAQAFVALAAAVSPSSKPQPFFAEFPVSRSGKRLDSVWNKWRQHDLTSLLETHATHLKSYEAVTLDCGTEEDLLPMNVTFSAALRTAGVDHTFERFEGSHTNRVVSQLRKKVLPLFSNVLDRHGTDKPNCRF